MQRCSSKYVSHRFWDRWKYLYSFSYSANKKGRSCRIVEVAIFSWNLDLIPMQSFIWYPRDRCTKFNPSSYITFQQSRHSTLGFPYFQITRLLTFVHTFEDLEFYFILSIFAFFEDWVINDSSYSIISIINIFRTFNFLHCFNTQNLKY